MNIHINFDPLKQRVKVEGSKLFHKPVPLGYSVIGTTIVLTAAQVILLRKYNLSFILAKKA